MTSEELAIDSFLVAVLGTSDALNLALASIRSAMRVINDGNQGSTIDHFALLESAADIIECRREIMDEVETALQCLQNPADTQNGYQAANAWYGDLDKRASEASGYFVPSNLRHAFDALPIGQHGAFLDAIGTLFVTWKVCGEPSADDRFDIAESIALDAMTPAEQDEEGDAALATHAGGQS